MHLKYLFWQLLIILKLIGIYDMPLESGRTLIILEVRRRLWCLFSAYDRSARKPRKKNKKIGNSEKKFWVAAILAGRSEHSKLTKF